MLVLTIKYCTVLRYQKKQTRRKTKLMYAMRILLLGFHYQLTTGLNMTPHSEFDQIWQRAIRARHQLPCHYLQACLFTV